MMKSGVILNNMTRFWTKMKKCATCLGRNDKIFEFFLTFIGICHPTCKVTVARQTHCNCEESVLDVTVYIHMNDNLSFSKLCLKDGKLLTYFFQYIIYVLYKCIRQFSLVLL